MKCGFPEAKKCILKKPECYFFQVNTTIIRLSGRSVLSTLLSNEFSVGLGQDDVAGMQMAD